MNFTDGQVRDLVVGLPPGMVGNPNATPKCTVDEFNAANCPVNTRVGSVSATATILGIVGPVPASGFLYNMAPNPGEPARFGIILNPLGLPGVQPIKLPSAVQLRPDFGLSTIVNDIPRTTLLPNDTTITSQHITLFGHAPDSNGNPFMRNPTSCGEKTVSISATGYDDSEDDVAPTFEIDNCDALDFSPAFSALIGGAVGGQQTTVTTSIDQAATEAGLLKATVAIPPDLNPDLNPAASWASRSPARRC
jgi:hypothetical protein